MGFYRKRSQQIDIACCSLGTKYQINMEEHLFLVTLSWFHTVCAKDMNNTCSFVASCTITLQHDKTFILQTRAMSRDHNINTILE